MGERSRLPGRRQTACAAAAQRRRVEGHRPGTRRRGGAHRPPGRPRVPRQLQVPVRHPVQRVPLPRIRRSPRRRAAAADQAARSGWPETGTPRWRRRSTRCSTPRSAGRRWIRTHTALASAAAKTRPPLHPSGATGGVVSLPGLDGDGAEHGRRCRPPQCRPAPRRAAQSAGAGGAAVRRAARGAGRVAATGVARVHQGALRPVVRGRGQRVGPALGAGHGGAGGNGEAMLWRLLRMGGAPVLRPGLVGHPLVAPAHRHAVGLAPALPAALPHDGTATGGQPRVAWAALVRDRTTSEVQELTGTSRCAGATGASAGRPKPRATWTRLITSCRGITPCDDRVRPHRLHAAAAGAAAGLPTGRAPALPRLGSGPGPPGLGRCPHPVDLVHPPPLQRRRRAGVHRAPAPAGHRGRRVLLRHRRGGRADSRPRVHRAVAARNRERAGLGRLLAGRRRPWTWFGHGRAPDPGDFGFAQLAIPRLHLFVEPWNVASARTAEAAGFTREATLRGWERIDGEQHDADCYALLRTEWTANG